MIRAALLLLTLAPVQAGAFDLAFPVACTLGDDCFIQQYMDHDPGPQARDFACGPLSYDAHSGTDFALPTEAAMAAGVAVRAAAPGVVKGARDGVPDIRVSDPAAPPLNGRDCGNGVLIDHGAGWETQYCHLKHGSIRVQPGDAVTAGQPLGQIGLSGNTEFPHLHLSLRHNGAAVDPFAPTGTACTTAPGADLWTPDLPYTPGGLIGIGLAANIPEFAAIKAGLPPEPLTPDSPALVLWAYYFGNRAADTLHLRLTGPDGAILDEILTLDRPQAQAFRATGKRLRGPGWPPGAYTGTATLRRAGQPIDSQIVTVTLR